MKKNGKGIKKTSKCDVFPQTVYCWGSQCFLGVSALSGMLCLPRWAWFSLLCGLVSHLVFQLVWDAVSASLGLPACLLCCFPSCLPPTKPKRKNMSKFHVRFLDLFGVYGGVTLYDPLEKKKDQCNKVQVAKVWFYCSTENFRTRGYMNPGNCAFTLSRDYFVTAGRPCLLISSPTCGLQDTKYQSHSLVRSAQQMLPESLMVNKIWVIPYIKHGCRCITVSV